MRVEVWFGPGADGAPAGSTEGYPRTALPVEGGAARNLIPHLTRLEEGLRHLGQPDGWVRALVPALEAWLRAIGTSAPSVLRLVAFPEGDCLRARFEPWPETPSPYLLARLPHPLAARRPDPMLAHKGLSGAWHEGVLRAAQARGAADALLVWADGTLAETAIAGVALEREGRLLLPPAAGRVASLAERLDLPAWAQARGLPLEVSPLPLAWANEGQIWCFNAVRGVWPGRLL